MKLLFAGFETDVSNQPCASSRWLEGLEAAFEESEHTVKTLALPYAWETMFEPLEDLLKERWDAIILFGSKESEVITIERFALNDCDVSVKDAAGRRPLNRKVMDGGQDGFWTGLPFRELAARFAMAKIPAAMSHSAGMGLSNFLFYRLMHALSESKSATMGGLIQFPMTGMLSDPTESHRIKFVQTVIAALNRSAEDQDSLQIDRRRLEAIRESLAPSKSGRP